LSWVLTAALTDLLKEVGRHVGAVAPDDCVQIGVETGGPKDTQVFQRFEYLTGQFRRQFHQAHAAVLEAHVELVAGHIFD
jgi:hypothetical protein